MIESSQLIFHICRNLYIILTKINYIINFSFLNNPINFELYESFLNLKYLEELINFSFILSFKCPFPIQV